MWEGSFEGEAARRDDPLPDEGGDGGGQEEGEQGQEQGGDQGGSWPCIELFYKILPAVIRIRVKTLYIRLTLANDHKMSKRRTSQYVLQNISY